MCAEIRSNAHAFYAYIVYTHTNGGVFCCYVYIYIYTHATCNDMKQKKHALRVRCINNVI